MSLWPYFVGSFIGTCIGQVIGVNLYLIGKRVLRQRAARKRRELHAYARHVSAMWLHGCTCEACRKFSSARPLASSLSANPLTEYIEKMG